MDRRAFLELSLTPLASASASGCASLPWHAPSAEPLRPRPHTERALSAMRAAVRFMTERVAYRGGYLWAYLPDFSRGWGELEARRSMLWIQPPGTPSVGHVFLDAYHATGEELYHAAAASVARALIAAQHPSGGWNYVYDFTGSASLAEWYATIGCNAWRLEEFHRNPDNSTFDDACTSTAAVFLLRMAVERHDAACESAVARVLALVEASQYGSGGWPQRYPLRPDYTRAITFNDDVIGQNIELCMLAHLALGDAKYLRFAHAAMDCVIRQQQPSPQPAWGLQHSLDGRPCAARTFEPAALATHTTARNIERLLSFYGLGGDRKFLSRVPAALDWLDAVALPPELVKQLGGTHPTFIEVGTNQALYVHRRGSNVVNGKYYVSRDPWPVLGHYSSVRTLDVPGLRRQHAALLGTRVAGSSAGSPPAPAVASRGAAERLPRYFAGADLDLARLYRGEPEPPVEVGDSEAAHVLDQLSPNGAWLTPLELTSNPYAGDGSPEPHADGDYASTLVGDRTDTSPYRVKDVPRSYTEQAAPLGISMAVFIRNMVTLIRYVRS